jgi:hypothetical protein
MTIKASLQDMPIQTPERTKGLKGAKKIDEDTIGILPYAQALASFIEDCDTPMTVGLQGDWGIGKTSLMNLIKGVLTHTECVKIDFNTWSYSQFGQDEYLGLACIEALTKKVKEGLEQNQYLGKNDVDLKEKFSNASSTVWNVLKSVTVQVPGVNVNVGEVADKVKGKEPKAYEDLADQMFQFKKQFEELVKLWTQKKKDNRIVIFIDDLDRVKPIKSLELLESIKNFMDIPGCVFVLAVDYEVVQMGMAEKLGVDLQKTSGKSFFDKIIQLPFGMPDSSYDIDKFLKELISKIQFTHYKKTASFRDNHPRLPDGDIGFFREITICTVGRNPRSIKRVMNYAKLLDDIRTKFSPKTPEKDDMLVLYALICMQIAWPELFAYVAKNPTADTISDLESWEFLDKLPDVKKLFERVPDEETVKNNISTYFDTLFSLLDKDQNGEINSEEMEPVRTMMELAKMTNVSTTQKPREYLIETLFGKNNSEPNRNVRGEFVNNVFIQSEWFRNNQLGYKKSGSRYVTLVYNRKQIGSIVSIKKRPFVFRLASSQISINDYLENRKWLEKLIKENEQFKLEKIVRGSNEFEYNLTGFGNTIIDYVEMYNSNLEDESMIRLLNNIYTFITNQTTNNIK